MNPNRPLFKIISATVALLFFITQTGWAQDQQYIPFNENQDQSQYLTQDQLQRFSDIKTELVEQHNAASGTPLQTEEEIITYLYDLINPQDFLTLKQLESGYNTSVAEKEAAWQDFIGQKTLLEDYYNQLDYLTSSLGSINLQIESVEQKINDVEQDKEETQTSIQTLESRVASKSSSVQSKLLEASALESDIDDLKAALSQLNDEKVVRKSDLDSAEALLNEKTAQKETLEAELDVILIDLNAKWEEVEAAADPAEKAQKEAEHAALQILYDDKLAAYDSFMLEYTAAQTAYQIALSAYENKLSAIDAAENEITQSETDLLSDYEAIKLMELEIDTLDEDIAAATSHYDYLGSMKSSLNGSLDRLNSKKTELETLYGLALNSVEQALEESGTNDKLQAFKAAVESEKMARSLYEAALEARNSLISSLKNQDKKLQSALLAIILESSIMIQQEDQGEVFYETGGQTVVLTEDQINDIILAMNEGVVLADGETVSEEINRAESVRRSLRENYSKVFGREPTEKMLNAFVDLVSRAKMPAIRLFEVLQRINDKNLKATEDQKLDAEDSAIDPGDVERGLQDDLLLNIVTRLQDKSFSSELIKGAISYLTTLPLPLVSCGIMALGGLFEQIGKSASESKLAEEAILSDIFSGAINKDTTGELKLSLFALKQAAEANGVTLYGQNISAGTLENANSPFIAHINGNHYVLVRKVENGQVTYFDPAPGSDQTTSAGDFCRTFTGNVLALNTIGGGVGLSDDEMKGIFGAGLFSKIKSAVSKAVSKVSSAAKSVASSVSKAVSTAAKTVSNAVSSAAKAVSNAVSTAAKTVSNAASSAAKAVSNAVSTAVSSAKSAVSKAVSSVSNTVKNTVEKAVNAVSEAVSEAKDAIASAAEKAKETAAEVKDAVINYVSEKAEQARTIVSEKAEQAKTFISNKIDQAKTYVANKVEAAKKFISDKAEAAREFISDKAESVKETVLNKVEELKDYASNKLDKMKNSASDAFDSLKEGFNNYVDLVVSSGSLIPIVAANDLEYSGQEGMCIANNDGLGWEIYALNMLLPFPLLQTQKPEDAESTDTFFERADKRLQQALYYLLTPQGLGEIAYGIGKGVYNWAANIPDRFIERYNEWPRTNNLGIPQVLINVLAALDGVNYSVGGHIIEGIIDNTVAKYNARTDAIIAEGAPPVFAHVYAIYFGAMDFIGVTKITEAITGRDNITFDKLTPGERFDRGTVGLVQVALTMISVAKLLKPAAAGATEVTYTATVGGQAVPVTYTPITYTMTGTGASASWTITAGEGAGYLGASQGINLLDDFAYNFGDDAITYSNNLGNLGNDFTITFGDKGVTYTNIYGTTSSENIEMVSPGSLVGRQVKSEYSGSNLKHIKKDMIQNGWNGPPIEVYETDGVKIILDGHHRARVAGAAGLDKVPVRSLTEKELWTEWGLTPGALQAQADEALFERMMSGLPR